MQNSQDLQNLKQQTVLIIGLGLIGGSLAKALKHHQACHRVLAYGRQEQPLKVALTEQVIDGYALELHEVLGSADIIVIATPLGSYSSIFAMMHEYSTLMNQAIVTDVGSVKSSVIHALLSEYKELLPRFVPGHPIAGSEQSGFQSADPHLFLDRSVVLTPSKQTNRDAEYLIRALWSSIGANVIQMSAEMHDRRLALTSHLPHLLAAALVNGLDPSCTNEYAHLMAGGFRDATRIAAGDPALWRDILFENRSEVSAELTKLQQQIQQWQTALQTADEQVLYHLLASAQQLKHMLGH